MHVLVPVVGQLLLGSLLGGGGIGITSVLGTTRVLVAIGLRHSAPTPLLSAQLYGVVLVVLVALVAVPVLSDLLQSIHLGLGTMGGSQRGPDTWLVVLGTVREITTWLMRSGWHLNEASIAHTTPKVIRSSPMPVRRHAASGPVIHGRSAPVWSSVV